MESDIKLDRRILELTYEDMMRDMAMQMLIYTALIEMDFRLNLYLERLLLSGPKNKKLIHIRNSVQLTACKLPS
jgi:hypothetical protein